MNFADWLMQRRQQANLTLRELAKKSGLSLPYVAALERGTSEAPPLKTCKALARGLGISSDEAWRRSFEARLERWLKRQGYFHVSTEVLVEIAERIEGTEDQGR